MCLVESIAVLFQVLNDKLQLVIAAKLGDLSQNVAFQASQYCQCVLKRSNRLYVLDRVLLDVDVVRALLDDICNDGDDDHMNERMNE